MIILSIPFFKKRSKRCCVNSLKSIGLYISFSLSINRRVHWVASSICVLGFIFIIIFTQEENQLWQLSLRFLPHKTASVNSGIGTEETRYSDFQEKREERRRRGTGN